MRPIFFALLSLLLLLTSCSSINRSPVAYSHIQQARTAETKKCYSADSYGYEFSQTGEFNGFVATVHSQVSLEKSGKLDANHVAAIAWSVYSATYKKWPLNYLTKDKREKIYNMLANTHVIVATDNEELQKVWGRHRTKTNLNGRMMLSSQACFEPVNNTYFFAVRADRFNRSDITTLTHEMSHAVSAALFAGDADPYHKNPDLWKEKSKENSIDSIAVAVYNYLSESVDTFQ